MALTKPIILILKNALLCSQFETTISTISNTDIISVIALIYTTIDPNLAFDDIVKFIRSITAEFATDPLNAWFHNPLHEFHIRIRQIQPIFNQPVVEVQAIKILFTDIKEYKVFQSYTTTWEQDFMDTLTEEYIGLKLPARFILILEMDIRILISYQLTNST
jgi:hypothetical protein